MIKLSERLMQVASLVPEGARLADVGTDHGYVPLWLLEKGRIVSAIGMDVNRGPLTRAKENRARYGYTSALDLRLSDGLEKLRPGEADTLLIAGMGGPLMIQILEKGRSVVTSLKTLVLQPQSEIPKVRRYLVSHGYTFEEEIMLKDDGKYYMAMRVVPGKEEAWTDTEYLFGKKLLGEAHPVLKEFLLKEENMYTKIRDQLFQKGQEGSERFCEVQSYLEAIGKAKTYYDHR